MKFHFEILPPAQKKLWPLLKDIPNCFTLYGGTAIALQLGHRMSVDFDFFSEMPLDKNQLLSQFKLLNQTILVQPEINTLNFLIAFPEDSIKLQFLAGLGERQCPVDLPIIAEDNQLKIASLRDLFATKLNTIQHRAECKDYIDIDAIIQSGLSLEEGLGCAQAVYGAPFDPASSLRALCSYRDGNLSELSHQIKKRLLKTASSVEKIPVIRPK